MNKKNAENIEKNIPDECTKCVRLCEFITQNRQKYPDFFNAPVPAFGDETGEVLVVGLAPGLKGANRTGRPFTGDYAGELLYATLADFGFLLGNYQAKPDDGITLLNLRITNAVRCVPPQNKVLPAEVMACNLKLKNEITMMSNLKVIVALGSVAHNAVLLATGQKRADYKFGHSNIHKIGKYTLIDSYHCSRYNTNTGRLTKQMFAEVFVKVRQTIEML